MAANDAGPAPLSDWGVPVSRTRMSLPVAPVAVTIVIALILGAVGGPILGGATALAALVLLGAAMVAIPGRVLRREQAALARPEDAPRLHNLVGGLSRDLGLVPPEVWVAPGPPNAVALHLTKPIVCVRKELLESFTRTELEATVAYLLTGIVMGAARAATIPRWASFGARPDPAALDVYSASVTRYPPALAAALAKCSGSEPPGLWLAGDGDVERRAAALLDL